MSPRFKRTARLAAAGVLLGGSIGVVPAVHAAPAQATTATYTIGLSLPYLELKELANGIQHGVQVAVAQANAKHLVPGVTFAIKPIDDTINGKHDGAKDAQNARQLINDGTVIGEVGPLNSSAAKVSMPVYNANGLAQISPSNTNPDLTAAKFRAKYEPTTASGSGPITYFRTCSTDIYQGHGDANYAKKIGVKSVFVTDNQGTYGIGLASYFKEQALKIGLKVLGSAELDANNIATSAQSLATTIAAKKPDLVFFGGEYGAKGGAEILADNLVKAGLSKFVFMGGDGIFANSFIKGSSQGGASHTLASNPGPDPKTDPGAAGFVKAEAAMFPGTSVGAYDTYSYDAGQVLINAFAKAVKDGTIKVGQKLTKADRLAIVRALAGTKDFRGASGTVTFDANGDVLSPVFSVYKVVGTGAAAHWVFQAVAPQNTK